MSTRPRLTVLGTGYLGATHAACMASLGFEVLGVDVDRRKLDTISAGRSPFHEDGLDELIEATVTTGHLAVTDDYAKAAEFGDIHFLALGTPQIPGGTAADTSYLEAAIDALAPHLTRPALIVGKSTVPVGTAEKLRDRARALAPAGDAVELVWNPEFLREGFAVQDTLRPDRIVLGTDNEAALAPLLEVYADALEAGSPLLVTDLRTAELVKVAANSFLATKISFINAMAEVCEAASADVMDLAAALGHDTRIGNRFLHPGLGFGGGCLPKDIRAFQARATELGAGRAVAFLSEVDQVNTRRRERTVDLAERLAGGDLAGQSVAVLGAAFKPDTDDVRDSPALAVAAALRVAGADVRVYDPAAALTAKAIHPQLEYVSSLEDALRGAAVTVLGTEWAEFREADPAAIVDLPEQAVIIDARNVLDRGAWARAGWHVESLGRASAA